MKQHGDQAWCGHREITYAAVARLYRELAGPDGRIRGADEARYAHELDKAQAHMDRPVGAGMVENFANTGRRFPYVGLGPTAHSAYANPNAQVEHFMASPYADGRQNLAANAEYLHAALRAARGAGSGEMAQLGAAAHALQDSYSGAHAWRDLSVYRGDPTAAVSKLHVFTPIHVLGIDDGRNTHHDAFDKPPARSGSTEAAVEATYRMLSAYERGLADPRQAERLMEQTLAPMLQESAAGVAVSRPDREFEQERDYRLGVEQGTIALPPEGVLHFQQVAQQQGPQAAPSPARLSATETERLSEVLAPHAGRAARRSDTGARETPGRDKSAGQSRTRG